MRIHTLLNAAAITLAATLIGCGPSEQQKFPCKPGEVLTAVGVCAAPTDLVPKDKTCAQEMLQQSDGTCVPPASPEEPWVFPCEQDQVLNANGACAEKFPCAPGNVMQADGSCIPPTADDLARVEATSRVYVSQENPYVEYRDTDGQSGSFGTGYFAFHAVGEPFVVTTVGTMWFGDGNIAPNNWLINHSIGYSDEGGLFHTAYIDGHPQDSQTIRLYVPKDGKADLVTSIFVDREVCRTFNGFATFSMGFELARIEAQGLTTGKRITLSQRRGEYVRGNRTFVCGSAPDPRLATPRIGTGGLVKGASTSSLYYTKDRSRYTFMDQMIYNTWFKDFSQVQSIPDGDLASMPLAGNVSARPGTLIKLAAFNEVYLITECRKIRRFVNDQIIRWKFGPGWETQVKTVSDLAFTEYTIGEVLYNVEQMDLFSLSWRTLADEISYCQ